MKSRLLALFCWATAFALPGSAATVLVLQFHNASQHADLNWVGESVAETLMREISAANEIVLDRGVRLEATSRLSLRAGAQYTKATLIKLGQTVDADYICYGTYDFETTSTDAEPRNSVVRITAHFLDLRKLHDGPELSETGKLSDLSPLEEHLAWQALKYLEPTVNFPQDRFMAPQKLIRLDAEESYIRGLLSSNKTQQEKWFAQAAALEPHFSSPVYELGKLALDRRDYQRALTRAKAHRSG